MVFLWRVARTLVRRRIRTVGVAVVIGLVIGGFLVFHEIGQTIGQNISSASAKLTDLAQVTNSEGIGVAMTSPSLVSEIQSVSGVISVQRAAIVLVPPPPPEEAIDVTSVGTILSFTCVQNEFAGCPITITSGRDLSPADQYSNVALQTQAYAMANGQSVGSSVDVGGASFTIVGLYTTGGSGDSIGTLIMPYPAASAVLSIAGPSRVYVTVESSSSLASVVASLQSKLGSGYVVQGLSSISGSAQQSLDSVASSAQIEAYLALAGGASVMAVVMVLVTSPRVREVGLLRALGFTRSKIAGQVTLESLLWSTLGLPIGLAISIWLGPVFSQLILGSAAQSGVIVNSQAAANPLAAVSFGLNLDVVLLATLVTVAIAMVGALYPVLRSIRMRPAEALRQV
jgi:ABC-type antimicrobial peptide transport system permease subunit